MDCGDQEDQTCKYDGTVMEDGAKGFSGLKLTQSTPQQEEQYPCVHICYMFVTVYYV